MKREEGLLRDLREMIKETKAGKIFWRIEQQTTEYNDLSKKPVVVENGKEWLIDECFVSFYCEYKGEEFLMITYEMIHTAGKLQHTNNLVFLPPLHIRYFDLNTLLPYAIDNSNMITFEISELWKLLLDMYRNMSDLVTIDVRERELMIEE